MDAVTDLFLRMPLSEGWLRGLLFVTFGLHLLFVLLMLGTAMLSLFFFLHGRATGEGANPGWDRHVAESHLGLKSLAVVLGVGPLLLIQVKYSNAFFTATGLNAYAWLAVIPLLICAFLLIDAFAHKLGSLPRLSSVLGVLGVGLLLTVPAVFTGALSLMERPDLWAPVGAHGFADLGDYVPHWVLRYLHVLGASLVLGAAFHLFFSASRNPERAARLRRWVFGATLFQVVVGLPLVFTLMDTLSWPVVLAVTVGTLAAMAVLWALRPAACKEGRLAPAALLALLPVALVAMLTARQMLQEQAMEGPHQAALEARAEEAKALAPLREEALAGFKAKLATVHDNGATIFEKSCAPCHGLNGRGKGPAARRLLVQAEDIASVRVHRDYLHTILAMGVPGSAMPYFTVFDRGKLESVMDELDKRFQVFSDPGRAGAAGARAEEVWADTCATCHGVGGEVSEFGATLRPAPPDLTRFTVMPARAMQIISEGYPGTVMQPYRHLPEDVLRGLTALAVDMYQPPAR
ncbi:cytochrome c [Desulfocurvus sp. DL9XJH121]